MILKFSVQNFRGIKERAEIDFTASADKSLSECLMPAGKKKALPVIALYGENSSGKSTVLNAFMHMREMVCGKYSHLMPGEHLHYEPFALSGSSGAPTFFEVDFYYEDVRYLYSFSYNYDAVLTETLYYWPNGREALIFSREGTEYTFRDSYNEQSALSGRTASNRLYLTCACDWNYHGTLKPFEWFVSQIFCIDLREYECIPSDLGCGKTNSDKIISEMKTADASVNGITAAGASFEIVYRTEDGGYFSVPMERQPAGFMKYYKLTDAWIRAFQRGALVVLDDFGTGLSSRLTRHLAEMMQNPETNPNHAQLFCTTHDTSLMDQSLLRRDEIYLTEKLSSQCSTVVNPLTHFSPRKDKRIDIGYLNGEFRVETQASE